MSEIWSHIQERLLQDVDDYGIVWTSIKWGCEIMIITSILFAVFREIVALFH